MFPPTSFWGKPWWFGTPIAFSASSVLFQMLPFAYWTYKSRSSFGLTKQLTVFPFLISGLLWKIGDAGGIDPRTSRIESERSSVWATSLVRKGAANDIWSLSFVNAMVEQFSIAYGCKIGFVDAGHQSMCFSHANRLPFRLTCLAGGVQRNWLCQTDAFDALISIVMFPPTSFWGKPWWFGTPIAFPASSVLFQMLPFHIARTNACLLLVQQNSFPYFLFWFPGSFEKLEMRGIDPRTSRMPSERSTIWATSPLTKLGAIALSNLLSVIEIVEQSPLLHIVVILALSVRVINACVSHLPIACPPNWHAPLVGSKGAVYVRRMSLIVLSVEFMFPSTSFWG